MSFCTFYFENSQKTCNIWRVSSKYNSCSKFSVDYKQHIMEKE